MASDDSAAILNEIGQILAEQVKSPPDDLLLYAKVNTNVVTASIFELRDEDILYKDWPTSELTWPLLKLWELEAPGKRWAEMEYVVRDGKFTARFTYPEDVDGSEDTFERRDRIVWRNFGQLPIVYPPWPDKGQHFELK